MREISFTIEAWKIYLPYCMKRISDTQWIFLNRRYKPLGVKADEFIEYQKDKSVFKFPRDSVWRLEKILGEPRVTAEGNLFFYFYTDGYTPILSSDYFEKVRKVMAMDVIR